MKKLIIFFLAIGIISTRQLHSQKAKNQTAIEDKYILVDGHRMHYQLAGKGSPTVVFEAGHSSTLEDWSTIFSAIAKMTTVVSHDRLGMGGSEESNKARTFRQIALELHTMLEQAHIPPPYVLVGHSMGGAIVRAFASDYPGETVGLVLIDPINEYLLRGLTAPEKEKMLESMDSAFKNTPPTVYREFRMMKDEVNAGSPELRSFVLPDIPTALLVAGADRPPDWTNGLIDLYKAKFEQLSDSRLIVLNQSPHYVQRYEPSTVIEAIRRIIYPDAEVVLKKIFSEKTVDSAIAAYKNIRRIYPKDLVPERVLNTIGYLALKKNAQEAIKLFSLNAKIFPQSANVFDSLGEAYMAAGDKKQAIKNYERSMALDPKNENAKNRLKKLREGR
jgi:pimeloyl-ACP methyl ester carboxylesterase